MGGHDEQVGADLADGRNDFPSRVSVPDEHVDIQVLVVEGADDVVEVGLSFGDLGGGGLRAKELAGDSFLDV